MLGETPPSSLGRWYLTLGIAIVLGIIAAKRGSRWWMLVSVWPLATLLLFEYARAS